MKSLRLFTGNRLDLLAEELARAVKTPPASPFDPELIIVQSKGMERWVSMQLASYLGVCSNVGFAFPNAFVDRICGIVGAGFPAQPIFEPEFAAWAIMRILPTHLENPGFKDLRNYLQGSLGSLKHVQLSRRIAETFDQYVIYRPDLIERWEAGEESHWQAVLWRGLVSEHGVEHRATLGRTLLKKLSEASPGTFELPARVSVFGISYLPPFHANILHALAGLTEVSFFLLSPCKEYWSLIQPERVMGRIARKAASRGLAFEEQYFEEGNSLLASMGKLGRDFFELLTASYQVEDKPFFEDPEDGRLLTSIQSDILNLRNRKDSDEAKTILTENDRSIELHSCHSPMREVEVLHDHLLEMFEQDTTLLPKDILVMSPDIEAYAPFVQAVFDTPEQEKVRIPYSISDRSKKNESRLIDTFLSILDLPDQRVTASQVLHILDCPWVCSKYDLSSADLGLITRWVREVQIRWGIDQECRLKWCPVSFPENTWKAGFERLLLGYALPGKGERLFSNILPFDEIEGSEAAVLGRFVQFAEDLFKATTALSEPKPLSSWSETLLELCTTFFQPDGDAAQELNDLRREIGRLRIMEEVSSLREPVAFSLVRWHLSRNVERSGFGKGFLTGGVTFCSMLPMRSIPFEVICLLGMDVNAYPRQSKPLEFDLMAKHPRPGDRSSRNDDRYLFLEAILSARKKLYISYTGQSCRDNSIIPPSVLVSELMDTIEKSFTHPSFPVEEWLVTRHRLQPFSPAYFKSDPKLFSYSQARLEEARCVLDEKRGVAPFVSGKLTPPDETLKNISLLDLDRFFANPSRLFLNKRFGIYFGEDESPLEETEAFQLDRLTEYSLEQKLIECRLEGRNAAELFPTLRSAGELPHGTPGECAFKQMSLGVDDFFRQTEPYIKAGRLDPLDVDLSAGEFRVTGRIQPIFPQHLVRYRYANITAKDRLGIWLLHLLLNAARPPGYPEKSLLIGLDKDKWRAKEYDAVEESEEILKGIVELYWEGLMRPLPFFPETSLEYARQVLKSGKSEEEALKKAEPKWEGGWSGWAESKDPYHELCFRSQSPLNSELGRISLKVFEPLFAAEKDL